MRAANAWERDLIALAVRAFCHEFPSPDMPATPTLVETVSIELVDANSIADAIDAPAAELQGAPMVGDILRSTRPKALHASGVEFCWYRTTRNGVRSTIPGASSPIYSPTADDLGCLLSVEATPYASQ